MISPSNGAYLLWSGTTAEGRGRIGVIRGDDEYTSSQNVVYDSVSASGDLPIEAVIDDYGVMHIVGQEGGNLIYISRPVNGAASPAMVLCRREGEVVCSDPALSLEGVNALNLVYLKGGAVAYQRIDLSSPAITTATLTGGDVEAAGPRMGVDASGAGHAVWYAALPEPGLYYAGRTLQGEWSTPQLIARVAEPVELLLQVQNNGGVHVVWSDDVNVDYLHRDFQGSWTLPRALTGDGLMTKNLDLSPAPNGDLLVSWSGLAVNDWDIYCAKIGPEGQIRFAGNCLDTGGNSHDARLVMDANGAILFLWADGAPLSFVGWGTLNEFTLPIHVRSAVRQRLTIPATMTAPVLSFLYDYRSLEDSAVNSFTVELTEGVTTTEVFSTGGVKAGWTHQAISLAAWSGKSVTLTLALHEAVGKAPAELYLDEFVLGSVGPNLGVTVPASRRIVPGDQLVYTLTYANRGGVPVNGAVLTQTLPAELQFVAADPAPVVSPTAGSPLVWNLNELPPLTDGQIVVTATVSPTATGWSRLTSTVSIAAPGITELETADNQVDWPLQVMGEDLWTQVSRSLDCIPMETPVVYTITIGNRSSVVARNSWLTMTLPQGMSVTAADPAPESITGTQVLWNLGEIAAGDTALRTVVVTTTMSANAPWRGWITTTVEVGGPFVEPDAADNRVMNSTLAGFLRFLPWISKSY
jgi:uncharacterized repeat protein (TIGR01451 family)